MKRKNHGFFRSIALILFMSIVSTTLFSTFILNAFALNWDTSTILYNDSFDPFVQWSLSNGSNNMTEKIENGNHYANYAANGNTCIVYKALTMPNPRPTNIICLEYDFRADYERDATYDKKIFIGDSSGSRLPVFTILMGKAVNDSDPNTSYMVRATIGYSAGTVTKDVVYNYDPNSWHHIKAVLDYNTKKFYINFDTNDTIIVDVTNANLSATIARLYSDIRANIGFVDLDNVKVSLLDYAAGSIEIQGLNNLTVAPYDQGSIQYNAIVRDETGSIMAGKAVQWSLVSPSSLPSGVTFDTQTGTLNVSKDANDFETDITVKSAVSSNNLIQSQFTSHVIKQYSTAQEIADNVAQTVYLKTYANDTDVVTITDLSLGIKNDLVLDKIASNGTTIEWTSMNPSVVDNDGEITIPDHDTNVDLRMILTKFDVKRNQIGKSERIFTIKVPSTTDVRDTQAIRYDKKTVENFLNNLGTVSGDSDLAFPYDLKFGSSIQWISSDLGVVFNDGKVKSPENDKTVTLTAILGKGNHSETLNGAVTVKGTGTGSKVSTGTTYKASSGGSYYVAPVPTQTPEINPNTDPNTDFKDIGSVDWAKESIVELVKKGIIVGKQDSMFCPNDNITRAEFVKMIIKAFNLEDTSAVTDYKDVNLGDWYYVWVASAQKKGLISGYSDGTFGCDKTITRQEMSAIIFRIVKQLNINLKNDGHSVVFADDNSIQSFAREAVYAMQQSGIINGKENNLFAPEDYTTRAEAAKVVYAVLQVQAQ